MINRGLPTQYEMAIEYYRSLLCPPRRHALDSSASTGSGLDRCYLEPASRTWIRDALLSCKLLRSTVRPLVMGEMMRG
jgi:hypothetical protein